MNQQNPQYFGQMKQGMNMKQDYSQYQQHGRTVGNGASHSQNSQKAQPSVHHQAGSLASNHASKTSHFSKLTQQAVNILMWI